MCVQEASFLVLANKQDMPNAISVNDLEKEFDITK
jgi:hypothetical protein